MRKFVSFSPEVIYANQSKKKIKLSPGLFLLPNTHKDALALKVGIESLGYEVTGGSYFSFEGSITQDATPYEMFLGYCLAVTFFSRTGRATCRAVKELSTTPIDLYIDAYDKFGFDPDDAIKLQRVDIAKIKQIYLRVMPELKTSSFNPLRNSIEFFILFLKETQPRTRLLYLSICLESIFLEGETEGIGYKLGVRCARLLHYFDKTIDAGETFLEVKNGYDLRSAIIHGDNYQKRSETLIKGPKSKATRESDHILILERIVKNVLHFIFSDEAYCEAAQTKKLGQKIDTEIVLH